MRPLDGSGQHLRILEHVVVAAEREAVLGQEAVDDRDLFLEPLPAPVDIEEGEPELRVLLLPPPGPHADLDAALADLIDRDRGLRQERRRPEGHRRDERPEADPAGPCGERAEDGPGIGGPPPGDAGCAEVVVGPEQPFESEALGGVGERAPIGPGHALLALDHQAGTHPGSLSGMSEPAVPTERERAIRALLLGAVLGAVLAVLGRRART